MIVTAGNHQTLALSAGEVLTIVGGAVSSGSVYRLADSVGGQATLAGTIAASETATFGPYSGAARLDVVCDTGFLTYSSGLATPLSQTDLTNLDPITATAVELNAVADLSVNGAVVKAKVIPITTAPTGAEQDTAFDLPAKASLLDVLVDVTTAEATGATKTIDVGLKASESGGDADGFAVGLSVSSAGLKRGQATVTAGVFSANTRGAMLSDYAVGTNADDRGLYREKPFRSDSVTAKSVVYTAGSNDWVEFRGSLILIYVEVA